MNSRRNPHTNKQSVHVRVAIKGVMLACAITVHTVSRHVAAGIQPSASLHAKSCRVVFLLFYFINTKFEETDCCCFLVVKTLLNCARLLISR